MVCDAIFGVCTAKVAGTWVERAFYRGLSFLASLIFLVALAGIVFKAREEVTEVQLEHMDALPWPTVFFCFKGRAARDAVNLNMAPIIDSCGSNAPLVETFNVKEARTTQDCLKFNEGSPLGKEIAATWNKMMNTDEWDCSTLNEDGGLSSSPGTIQQIKMQWQTTVRAEHQYENSGLTAYCGVLDPKIKTFAEQADTFTLFRIPLVNSESELSFTVDKMIEKDWTHMFTSTEIGDRAKTLSEVAAKEKVAEILKDDAITLKYNPSLNSKAAAPMVRTDGNSQTSELLIQPMNYVSRTVTTRPKTWDEVWTSIGGAWATAVLLVTIFFVQKEVKVPPEHPVKQKKTKPSKRKEGKARRILKVLLIQQPKKLR
jgi:hypothetical protein